MMFSKRIYYRIYVWKGATGKAIGLSLNQMVSIKVSFGNMLSESS